MSCSVSLTFIFFQQLRELKKYSFIWVTECPPFWERVLNSACRLFFSFCDCLIVFFCLFSLMLRTWCGPDCISSWIQLFTLIYMLNSTHLVEAYRTTVYTRTYHLTGNIYVEVLASICLELHLTSTVKTSDNLLCDLHRKNLRPSFI